MNRPTGFDDPGAANPDDVLRLGEAKAARPPVDEAVAPSRTAWRPRSSDAVTTYPRASARATSGLTSRSNFFYEDSPRPRPSKAAQWG